MDMFLLQLDENSVTSLKINVGHISGIPYTSYSFRVKIGIWFRIRIKVRIRIRVGIRVRD